MIKLSENKRGIIYITVAFLFSLNIFSCGLVNDKSKDEPIKHLRIYAKEPNDSTNYKFIKYTFYQTSNRELYERKLASARHTDCNCEFIVYYDKDFRIYQNDTDIIKPLQSVIDIDSYELIDSSDFSKDKRNVYFYSSNSDGGVRQIVKYADPKTFKRLCEYRWGFDNRFVFYEDRNLKGLNINKIHLLNSLDTTNHFVDYIKDNKLVFYRNEQLENADAKTFHLIDNKGYDAEDRFSKYENGKRKK